MIRIKNLTLIIALIVSFSLNAQSKEEKVITNFIEDYFVTLNKSDKKIVSFFAKDGELLPPQTPTAKGHDAIDKIFEYVFENFNHDLEVSFEKIIVQKKYATVASAVKGTFTSIADNKSKEVNYRGVFILQKEKDNWKIARYIYNSTH